MKVYSVDPGAVVPDFTLKETKWKYYYRQHDQYGKTNIFPDERFDTAGAAKQAMRERVVVLRRQLIGPRMLG